jgi:hypothetical protein
VTRTSIAALAVAAIGTTPLLAFQTFPIKACSVLTRDLVEPFSANKRALDLFPPEEEATPTSSACEWGVVRLQLYSARPGTKPTAPKDYAPLAGVGDTAFFRNNSNTYAELLVWSGSHHLTLQVGVPAGGTVDAIKPKTVALAQAILKKLPSSR